MTITIVSWFSARGEGAEPVHYDVEVRLVLVDVVVTDRQGKHITGLTKDDFELYEDGELQEITDFSEESLPIDEQARINSDLVAAAGKTADLPEGRWFVLFFDESNMTANDVAQAREAAREFVRYGIFPNDRVAILRFGNTLELSQDFTGDVDKLAKALYAEGSKGTPNAKAFTQATGVPAREKSSSAGNSSSPFDADVANQGSLIRFQDSPDIGSLESFHKAERLYKVLSFAGKTLSRIRGRKTLVFFSGGFNSAFADHGLFRTYREMVNSLNQANVAIYALDTSGLSGRTPADASTGVRDRQGRVDTPTGASRALSLSQVDSLKVLAADTGGRAFTNTGSVTRQLERMAYSTSSYYLLGYTPTQPLAAGSHDVKVKALRSGATVLARKSYQRAASFDSMSRGEKKRQMEDALISWVDLTDLPLTIRTHFFPDSVEKCRLGIEVGLLPGILSSRDGRGEIELTIYLTQEKGKKVLESTERIGLTEEEALSALRYVKGATLKPGAYWLKVLARDDVSGKMGTASARITVPEFDDDRPLMSSIVLLAERGRQRVIGKERARFADLLEVAGREVVPSPENRFEADGEAVCFFRVRNIRLDPKTGMPRLVVRYTVYRANRPVSQQTVHYQAGEGVDYGGGIPIYSRIPLGQMGSGNYRLEVSSYDVVAGKGMKADVAFTVTPSSADPTQE